MDFFSLVANTIQARIALWGIMPGEEKYRGVHFSWRMRGYIAQHKIDKKGYYLGTYDTAKEAAVAYDKARVRAFKKGIIKKVTLNFEGSALLIKDPILSFSSIPGRTVSPLEAELQSNAGNDWSYLLEEPRCT